MKPKYRIQEITEGDQRDRIVDTVLAFIQLTWILSLAFHMVHLPKMFLSAEPEVVVPEHCWCSPLRKQINKKNQGIVPINQSK